MRTLIVLKENEYEALGTAESLEKRGEEIALVMMLDAVYMATVAEENAAVKDMMEKGSKVLLLRSDVERRGLEKRLLPGVELIDYEGLIDILFSEDQRVLNL